MLISIDKRGSINLPIAVRKELGLKSGTYLDLDVVEGGAILLRPVAIYPGITLNDVGAAKLRDARKGGDGTMPGWISEDMKHARTDTEP